MDISIIIVNYNTAAIISACINSVLQQKNVQYEIIVIDNASHDHSLELLKSHGDQIKLIANPENSGFGKANNIAAQQANGRYLFLLNPDANLKNADDLAKLVTFMDQHPQTGLAGPVVIKNQQQTKPQYFYPGQKYLNKSFSDLPGKIAWVIGACMIIRRDAFILINGFDETYFLYAEETDLCLRMRQKGFAIGYCDQVVVDHIGGASEKAAPTPAVWRRKQNGLHIFYRKHYSANEIQQLLKRDYKLAKWKLFLLRLKKIVARLSSDQQAKFQRHEVIIETSKEFLQKN